MTTISSRVTPPLGGRLFGSRVGILAALALSVSIAISLAGCTTSNEAQHPYAEVTWSPAPDDPLDSDPAVRALREYKHLWTQAFNTLDSSDPRLPSNDAAFLFDWAVERVNTGEGPMLYIGPDPLSVLKVEPAPDEIDTFRVWVCEREADHWYKNDGVSRLYESGEYGTYQRTYKVTVDPDDESKWSVKPDVGHELSCDGVTDPPTAKFVTQPDARSVETFLANHTLHDVIGPDGVRGDQDVEWVDELSKRPVVRSPSAES